MASRRSAPARLRGEGSAAVLALRSCGRKRGGREEGGSQAYPPFVISEREKKSASAVIFITIPGKGKKEGKRKAKSESPSIGHCFTRRGGGAESLPALGLSVRVWPRKRKKEGKGKGGKKEGGEVRGPSCLVKRADRDERSEGELSDRTGWERKKKKRGMRSCGRGAWRKKLCWEGKERDGLDLLSTLSGGGQGQGVSTW